MNRCEKGTLCPLGNLAEHIGCRKPHCPKAIMPHKSEIFTKGVVIPVKKRKE